MWGGVGCGQALGTQKQMGQALPSCASAWKRAARKESIAWAKLKP